MRGSVGTPTLAQDVPPTALRHGLPVGLTARLVRDPVLAGLGGGTVIVMAWLASGRLTGTPQIIVYGLAQCVLDSAIVVLALRLGRQLEARSWARRCWWAMAGAGGFFLLGDLLQSSIALAAERRTYAFTAGWVGVPFVAGVVLMLALVAMATRRRSPDTRRGRLRVWLDSGTVLIGAGAYIWCMMISPALAEDLSALLQALTMASVVFATSFIIVRLIVSGTAPATWLALAGTACASVTQGVADAITPVVMAGPPFGRWLALRVLASAFVATMPRLHEIHVRADPAALIRDTQRRFSVLPYLTISATFILLIAVLPKGLGLRAGGALVSVMVICALVVLRQILAFSDNARLVDQLDRSLAEARALHDQLRHQASHDALTRLANRTLFAERLHEGRTAAATGSIGWWAAVLLIDLDGFKGINDTYGHHVGDGVLMAVADRLRLCVRPGDTVARLGGDEFAVLLPDGSGTDATRIAERFKGQLTEPIQVHGHHLRIDASVGIAVGPANDPEMLLCTADAAMYQTKAAGRRRAERASGLGPQWASG